MSEKVSIQLLRGTQNQVIASTDNTESKPFYATDTQEVYIGTGSGKGLVGKATIGLISSIPSAGIPGRIFYATDQGVTYISDGTEWKVVGSEILVSVAFPTTNPTVPVFLYREDEGIMYAWDVSGELWVDVSAAYQGGGTNAEANTASNIGTAGVGVFDDKVAIDLQFKKINAGSNKVTITDDVANNEVKIDVTESNFDLSNMDNSVSKFVQETQPESSVSVTPAGGNVSLDFDSKINIITISSDTEIQLPDMSGWSIGDIQRLDIYVKQDATGGHAFTWATGWKASAATLPTNTTDANAVDRFVIDCIKDLEMCIVGLSQSDLS